MLKRKEIKVSAVVRARPHKVSPKISESPHRDQHRTHQVQLTTLILKAIQFESSNSNPLIL